MIRTSCAVILIAIILCFALPCPAHGTVHILSIGIRDYMNVEDAPYADTDAQLVGEALRALCSPGDCIVRYLLNSEATVQAIRDALDSLAAVAEEDDIVVLFFAGHGNREDDTDGDEKGRDLYDETLMPYDGQRGKPTSQITDDELGLLTSRIEAKSVIVILDSCFSGGQGRSVRSVGVTSYGDDSFSRDILSRTNRRGRVIWAACTDTQVARSSSRLQAGVFSHYLVQSLKAAGNSVQAIAVSTLARQVRDDVWAYVANVWNGNQTPMFLNPDRLRVYVGRANGLESRGYELNPYTMSRIWDLGFELTGDATGLRLSTAIGMGGADQQGLHLALGITYFPLMYSKREAAIGSACLMYSGNASPSRFHLAAGFGLYNDFESEQFELLAQGSFGLKIPVSEAVGISAEYVLSRGLLSEYPTEDAAWMGTVRLTFAVY